MTEDSTKGGKPLRYKIKEDPAGLQNYDSYNLNLLGFENDVPMLTIQQSKLVTKVNKEKSKSEKVKSPVKTWNGKQLIIKSDAVVNNSKLLVVKYKNGKKVEIPGRSCNVTLGSKETQPGTFVPKPVATRKPSCLKRPEKLNYQVYNVQATNCTECNPITYESSSNVTSDHNYFTARRKSSDFINLVEPSIGEVNKNRSYAMSLQNVNDPKKNSSLEYKLFNRNDIHEDLLAKAMPKQVEALKIVKIIKPQMSSPPPLEVIRPLANKVYHNKKFVPPKVDGSSQTTFSSNTIGVNTDESLLNEYIESKVEELRHQPLDLDADLENCLKHWDMFNCDEFANVPLSNVQKNGKTMDTAFTNGSNFNAVSQSSNSAVMDWKSQLFSDLKRCDNVDMSGNRPLHLAVMQNNDKLVKRNCIALKARNIDINFTNNENLNALQLALMHNADLLVVETLLRNNSDTLVSDAEGNNILHLAVLYSNEDVVRLLVTTPDLCDVNACNFEGYTPLILCVINKRYVMADLLLSFDADPNIGDKKSGRTALFHAVEANDAEMVKLLINQKALTKVKNYFGTSPHDAMFELDSIDATIRKLVLNRDDVSSARPKIARGKRKRNGVSGEERQKIYKP